MKLKNKPDCWIGALFVALVALLTFLPVIRGEFLNWDDNGLFVENPWFRGLGPDQWSWMCTTVLYGHWQPLSWLSYALDYTVWGMSPHGWHVTNLLLHVVNSVLVYLLCLSFIRPAIPEKNRQTGASAAAALAALFWAVHPLRVEVVAWLSTRGYLLCTAFCLLTLLFYLRAADQKRYPLAALLCFTLASLTKGIGMMLPLVLLLVGWQRAKGMAHGGGKQGMANSQQGMANGQQGGIPIWKRLAETVPFFALSLMTGIAAFLAKKTEGGMASVEVYGSVQRIGQALYGIWFYLTKTVWPQNLSPLYEKPPELWQVLTALLLTTAAAVLLFLFRKKFCPLLLAVGSFLLLIFPMLGITQSGSQLFADRFTYLSTIPLFVFLAVGLVRMDQGYRTTCAVITVLLLAFGIQTLVWAQTWSSSLTLWNHVVSVEEKNARALNNLGQAFVVKKSYESALKSFDQALSIDPDYADAIHHRGLARLKTGDDDGARSDFERALEFYDVWTKDCLKIRIGLAMTLEKQGEINSAIEEYSTVIHCGREKPVLVMQALQARARLYFMMNDLSQGVADLEAVLKFPDPFGEYWNKSLAILDKLKKSPENDSGDLY